MARIGFLGPEGSYSEEAALRYAAEADQLVSFETMEAVVAALVADGDRIVVDVANHSIDLVVDEAELDRRRADLKHPAPRYTSGVLAKFARLVTGAERGAITEA